MTGEVRCLVADDHPALVVAVCETLEEAGYVVVGPAADGKRAVALARSEQPEFAVVDYRMPLLGGRELVLALREASPTTRVVVYTADADSRIAQDVIGAGAVGLLLKEAPLSDLARTLTAVQAGRTYVDPGVDRSGIREKIAPTKRELEVLTLIAEGLSQSEIGARLGIGTETVRTHLRNVCKRLNVGTKTQAVATALRLGLLG